jgi:fibronectin-binding autotransporter adhesin
MNTIRPNNSATTGDRIPYATGLVGVMSVLATLSTTSSKSIDTATVVFAGGATWNDGDIGIFGTGGTLRISSGTVFNATGNDSTFLNGGTPAMDIRGTFRKSGGTGTTALGSSISYTLGSAGVIESLTGTITLSGNLMNLVSATLTSGTYRAVGAILNLPSNVTTIAANTTVELSGGGSMPQLAALTTQNGTLNLIGVQTFTPTATSVSNGGTIDVRTGATFGRGIAVVSGGFLRGNGTVTGAVSVASGGVLAPGASPGTITLNSGLTFTGGTYQVEIAGPTTGNYDRTVVTAGAINLGSGVANLAFPSLGGSGFVSTTELVIIQGTGSAIYGGGFFNGLTHGSAVPALTGFGSQANW